LLKPNVNWSWELFGQSIINELAAFGFETTFIEKEKNAQSLQELLKIGVHSDMLKGTHRESLIRIKIEIDTCPLVHYKYEQKFLFEPVAVSVRCVDEESLFACRMYVALFRTWKNRVKG